MKILTIVGARPQIIKAAALSRAIQHSAMQLEEHILHTGQHYDNALSANFFAELDIPRPHYNLGVGSGTHGWQTARMLEGIEQVMMNTAYDGVVVYGDTNSTLAGALAASKLHVPVFHIEAGLRSHNMAMPEEVNRLVADRLATLLFAPTKEACANLRTEGYSPECIVNSGDVMYDNALHFGRMARTRSTILERTGLTEGHYVLATVHRNFNTDNPVRLHSLLAALDGVARNGMPVAMPLHPRTRAKISTDQYTCITFMEPAGYMDMLQLEQGAAVVATDSGGVQKEAYFMQRPCVILRAETEWTEIVRSGAALLADADPGRIAQACQQLAGTTVQPTNEYGDGHAAEKIIEKISTFAQ